MDEEELIRCTKLLIDDLQVGEIEYLSFLQRMTDLIQQATRTLGRRIKEGDE